MGKIIRKGVVAGIGVVFFLAFYPLRLAHYFHERLFFKSPAAYPGIQEVYAEVFYSVEASLKVLLPQAQNIKEETKVLNEAQKKSISQAAGIEFDPQLDKEYRFYIGQTNGQIIGYAVEDTVKGKWGPIHYMLALEPDGKIKDAVVLELTERRGRPVKERGFLGQFAGKTIQDPLKLKKDIKGVSGATISSRGMSDGIRKLVYVFNEFFAKKQ